MKMLSVRATAIYLLATLASGCVVYPAATGHLEKSLERDFEARANALLLTRPRSDYSFDRTAVLIGASFGPRLGITLVGKEHGVKSSADYYYLQASVFEIPADQPQSDENIHLTAASILRYQTEVTDSEVATVFNSLSNSGFFELNSKSERPLSDPKTYILDGMGYNIEAQIDGRKNLIVRSTCELGTSSDIKPAKELFELARQKFSTISVLLSEMEYMALSDMPC